MSGHDGNSIFFNKKKIGRPEHFITPTQPQPLRPITAHFRLTLTHPLQVRQQVLYRIYY